MLIGLDRVKEWSAESGELSIIYIFFFINLLGEKVAWHDNMSNIEPWTRLADYDHTLVHIGLTQVSQVHQHTFKGEMPAKATAESLLWKLQCKGNRYPSLLTHYSDLIPLSSCILSFRSTGGEFSKGRVEDWLTANLSKRSARPASPLWSLFAYQNQEAAREEVEEVDEIFQGSVGRSCTLVAASPCSKMTKFRQKYGSLNRDLLNFLYIYVWYILDAS